MTQELSTIKYLASSTPLPEPERRCSTKWTRGIWIVCIASCIAGCYGMVDGVSKGHQQLTGAAAKPQKTRTKKSSAAYRYEKEVVKFHKKYKSVLLFHRVFEFGAGAALLLGGALMMWRSPHGRKIVFAACLAALLFHLSTAMLKVFQFVSLKEFFESTSAESLRKAGVGGARHKQVLRHGLGSLGFGHSLGVLFMLGLHALFYGRMMLFVAQPEVREAFAEDPYPELREMEAEADAVDAIAFAESVGTQEPAEATPPAPEPPQRKTDADKFARV